MKSNKKIYVFFAICLAAVFFIGFFLAMMINKKNQEITGVPTATECRSNTGGLAPSGDKRSVLDSVLKRVDAQKEELEVSLINISLLQDETQKRAASSTEIIKITEKTAFWVHEKDGSERKIKLTDLQPNDNLAIIVSGDLVSEEGGELVADSVKVIKVQ